MSFTKLVFALCIFVATVTNAFSNEYKMKCQTQVPAITYTGDVEMDDVTVITYNSGNIHIEYSNYPMHDSSFYMLDNRSDWTNAELTKKVLDQIADMSAELRRSFRGVDMTDIASFRFFSSKDEDNWDSLVQVAFKSEPTKTGFMVASMFGYHYCR